MLRREARVGAVGDRLAEVGHAARVGDEPATLLVNSHSSSEWKRTVPRRGEPEPWWSTTIQARPLRSSLTTNTLKPACGSSLATWAPIGPKAGIPVRLKKWKARGLEPCS